jgi:eukaryotic-like serine/threonine-protein kinase
LIRFGIASSVARRLGPALESGLTSAFGEQCHVLPASSYSSLVDGLSDDDVDLAWLPPVAYLRARRLGAAHLLATIERAGLPSYGCALLGRSGAVEALGDLAGKRALWTDPWSAAGYLVPRTMLRARGVDPDQIFSSQGFVDGYEAVLAALRTGHADVGAAYCRGGTDDEPAAGPWQALGGVVVLCVGGPIPGDSVCAGRALAQDRREALALKLTSGGIPRPLLAVLEATGMSRPDGAAYDAFDQALRSPVAG